MNSSYYKESGGKWSRKSKAAFCLLALSAAVLLLLTSTTLTHVQAQRRSGRPGATTRPVERAEAVRPIKILFKWHGMIGPGGGGGGCDTPLGICFVIGLSNANSPLRRAEIAEGYGIALTRVKGNRLYMVFNREAALRDGTIRVSRDVTLAPEVSRSLGYERITIKAGTYKVNPAVRPFGETWMNIVKDGPHTNGPQNSTTCYLYEHTTGYGSGCGVACDDGTNYPMSCSADIFK
ncbi:MAG TPA: hypothetical protein VFZ44_09985 [Pyrinomonadaceae bacterium]